LGNALGFHILDRQVLEAILKDTRLGDRIVEAWKREAARRDAWISVGGLRPPRR